MANEINVTWSLNINKTNLKEQQSESFQATMNTAGGPTPGQVLIDTDGTDITISQVTSPGWAWFKNLDATNYVQWGIWEDATTTFYPVGQLLAGESCIFRLSPYFGQEYSGTGTGTSSPGAYTLRFKADTADVKVQVRVFEA